jgi:hypothetical protein
VTDELAISVHFNTSGLEILKKDILYHSLMNKKDERVFNVDHIGWIMDLTLRSAQMRGCSGILV